MTEKDEQLILALASIRDVVDSRLAALAPAGPPSESFNRAIRYSLLAPGKRLRPIITILTARCFGGDQVKAIDPACALEMIHTASLIVDDLPAMDDAKLRRGIPSNHQVFGEDKAILAGFALVNHAFDIIARSENIDSEIQITLIKTMAQAVGLNGIIAGQERDLHAEDTAQDTASIKKTYGLKTGAMFIAAAEIGARIAGLTGSNLIPIRSFGQNFGMAYQARDDLIDRHGTLAETGKDVGTDFGKTTLMSVVGECDAIETSQEYLQASIDALRPFGAEAESLARMSKMIFDPEINALN
jgi:geranylgeranyl diphosphate synthase type II